MSNHFFSMKRGTDGFKPSDITRATSSTTGDDVELRIADVDGQSKPLTRKDVLIFLDAMERLFQASGAAAGGTTFPPL